MSQNSNKDDHDLIIEMSVKLVNLDQNWNRTWNTINDKFAALEMASEKRDVQHEKLRLFIDTEVSKLEKRIYVLEKYRWWLVGALTVAGAVGGTAGTYLIDTFL